MTDDEKMEIHNEGFRQGQLHSAPSPETDRRMAILETNFNNINDDLKDIKTAISRSTAWLVTTLFSVLLASFSLAFWLGTWKGTIEEKINNIESDNKRQFIDINTLRNEMRGIAKEEVDQFAKKNFDSYNR